MAGFLSVLKDSISENFGDSGYALAVPALQVKFISSAANLILIRCAREQMPLVWASLTLMRCIRGRPMLLQLLHKSGSQRSAMANASRTEDAVLHHLQLLRTIQSQHRQQQSEGAATTGAMGKALN
eukprot:TRINITY_DN4291_c0_g1_i3.p1 TRINITY_DN4291_c0_g1~~TRINITY_DN4291_c0_g1_i3.p1  ORF type:complete len:143 (+),score=32.91 TRINITY_DN4291_c0_g1_i3:52-429(+)